MSRELPLGEVEIQNRLTPEEHALYLSAMRATGAFFEALRKTIPKPGKGEPSEALSVLNRALEHSTLALETGATVVCLHREGL